MDMDQTLVMARVVERIIIELGAIAAMVMGVLLYRWGIKGRSDLSAEGEGFTFKMTNAAPGALLAFFGMAILIVGLRSPVHVTEPSSDAAGRSNEGSKRSPTQAEPAAQPQQKPSEDRGSSRPNQAKSWSYGSASAGAAAQLISNLRQLSPEKLSEDEAQSTLATYRQQAAALLRPCEALSPGQREFLTQLVAAPGPEARSDLESLVTRASGLSL